MSLLIAGKLNYMTFKGHFQNKIFYDLEVMSDKNQCCALHQAGYLRCEVTSEDVLESTAG